MSKPIWELGARECRGPVERASETGGFWETLQLFCAAPTGLTDEGKAETYCPACKARYHVGHGKQWQGLAEMMRLTEQTVVRVSPSYGTQYETEASAPLDISVARETLAPSEKRAEIAE